ncbi:uncharacterized protein N7473_008232 [Penicillium subrubescens]|uniref:uncharacterized protein n=1 Tax=Penicillium subrubescens TaxID=1316194 RepID=UPI002545956C|nr:uncharacterized protein N7473_008232 [Penicillium subrubescens]KAJ5892004.1 hypothetical protein N7473_008232 [Penicillium subrubescens]
MSNPNDYNAGWICAIKTEYVAAPAFLDEKHEGPEYVSINDNNDYTLGKVGKHNVVISVLPYGEYGISSATGVAKEDMLHSFPNVRIGLMVGIGGGAPSPKHDIRLGDIVEFQETGVLIQPPKVLRAAVHGLRAQYELDGHQLEEAINSILKKKPRLQQNYKQPDPKKRAVRQSAVCSDDPSNLIPRRERTENENNPAIHYGLIASANRLMKDALLRDKLAKEKNVLCFEMEAAGLMNEFPCLVIRGICDYSDTHKNKEWQGYAAMAASAFAKDLLCRIAPTMVEAEKKISDQVHEIQHALSTTGANVAQMKSKLDKDEDIKVLNWLTPIYYAAQQKCFIGMRQPGTGQWLLDSDEYQAWLKADEQILFCPGIPGTGKTIITATIIDDLYTRFRDDTSIAIAYLYCDFRRQHEQKLEHLLANLLKQLAQRLTSIPDDVKTLYKQYKDQPQQPSLDETSKVLNSLSTFYSKVFIVIDALDECQITDGCRTRFLTEIFSLRARQRASICSTSRFILEILEKFKECTSLEIRAGDADATISKTVDGMFPSLCAGLVTIDTQSDVIRLVHYTTQQYFEQTQKLWFPEAETNITKVCITYLSFSVFESGFCQTYGEFEDRLKSNKLFDYAAQNWGHHARISSIEGDEFIWDFLKSQTKISARTQAIMVAEEGDRTYSETRMTGLNITAYFGLGQSTVALLNGQHSPSLKASYGATPLYYAAVIGHQVVVKLLLDKDADPNSKEDVGGATPLYNAVENGHQEVVKLLLDKDADPNTKEDRSSATPLHNAVRTGI